MFKEKILEQYCELALKFGVNLQKKQGLHIICPIERADVAKALTLKAYEMGAKKVSVVWENEEIDRLTYLYADEEELKKVPKWFVDSKNFLVNENYCYIAVSAENPSAFSDVPANRIATAVRAKGKALKKYSEAVMGNAIRWCVISAPTIDWAKQVFPNSQDPLKDLSEAIQKTMRLSENNTLIDWEKHVKFLNQKANFLNEKNFDFLHLKNKFGTDIKVGLADNHVWLSALEKDKNGIEFIANLPTEEVFTAPHKNRVDGVIKSALPLCYNGQIIDNFTIRFKDGKIQSFSAEKGYETLKNLIETDRGTLHLGEIALIGKNSPIAQSKILFFNTLFDENASCHLAIGKGYRTTIKNSEKLSKTELSKLGLNDSVEHVDFMIGTDDLEIYGVNKYGEQTQIFTNGEWTI